MDLKGSVPAGALMGVPMYYAYHGASPPARSGASHATIYPYGPFSNKNGDTVILGIQNEREWAIFCEHVILNATLASDPLFCTNSLRHQRREALQAIYTESKIARMRATGSV